MTSVKRQALRNQSARVLLWSSGILVLLAVVVISPAGRMLFLALAAIFGGISTFLGRGPARTFGFVVTLATLLLLGASYPAYKKHMDLYLKRDVEHSTTKPGPDADSQTAKPSGGI